MQKKKIIITLLLISLVLIMNLSTAFSYDPSAVPDHIKIGLFFGNTAKSTVVLESEFGFSVGVFQQDAFLNLLELNENKILLRKDKAYIRQGLDYMEYIGSINDQANLYNVEGPYHIQIGQDFTSYDEASNFLSSLNTLNIQGYLSYEDNWKVFAGLYLNESDAQEEASSIAANHGYETKVILPSTTRVQVLNTMGHPILMYDAAEEVYFMGGANADHIPLVSVEGTKYRGGITAKRLSNSDMTVINKLPLEEYLYGVVPGEMPASWHIEALKAQAVAARTFALSNFNKYSQYDFNLCTTTNSQVYKGYSIEHPNANRAIEETKSKVITHNGKLAEAYFHANSGGQTEDSENIWSAALPHIRGVKDEFSLDAPYSTWTETFTMEEIKSKLATHNIFIGDILDMKITATSKNGRVMSLVIYGTEGQEVLEKLRSRTVLGLKSNYYTISSDHGDGIESDVMVINGSGAGAQSVDLKGKYMVTTNGIQEIKSTSNLTIFNGKEYRTVMEERKENPSDTFTIEGKGNGHGLGMSQYGAKKMAELGYEYDEILTHYYTGVKVE